MLRRRDLATHRTLVAVLLVAVALVSPAGTAEAASSAAVKAAQAYCKAFGFKPKTAKVGPAHRQVTRMFVPVVAETVEPFRQAFCGEKGFLTIAYQKSNDHLGLQTNLGETWLRAAKQAPGQYNYFNHQVPPQDMTLHPISVTPKELAHARQWLSSGQGKKIAGHCFAYVANTELAPGLGLFHAIGITRSKSAHNASAKLRQVANQRAEVVGYCVPNKAAFDALDVKALLGNPPNAGIEDSAVD